MTHFAAAALAAFALLASPSEEVGYLTLSNDSDYAVTHVYVSPCEEEEWLGDLLGEDEVLMPGDAIDVEVEVGCWDLRAVVEADELLDVYTVEVEEGDELAWTISNAD